MLGLLWDNHEMENWLKSGMFHFGTYHTEQEKI